MNLSTLQKTISPPTSVILIEDQIGGDIPESMGDSLVASTRSCIAVGCKSESDGSTEIRVSRDLGDDICGFVVFDDLVSVPSKTIAIKTVFNENIMSVKLNSTEIKVKIITNDEFEPDKIDIEIFD
jgi:hypothetical protein